MADQYEGHKAEASRYFPSCPLCQREAIQWKLNDDWFARDYVVCSNCNAKWHIYFLGNLKWAKLIEVDSSGKGEDHLGRKYLPSFWFDMIVKKPIKKQAETEKQQPTVREPIVREKETIIRERETTYKVKCPYCGKLYNEVLDVCPHYGGKSS